MTRSSLKEEVVPCEITSVLTGVPDVFSRTNPSRTAPCVEAAKRVNAEMAATRKRGDFMS
jgi:hypothetical protein